ncbi:MAG: tRNA (cytidine(34)-2'-O)-methyltransferase [Rickettsiales bacterium]|jgi:tRNA (cytidine/uridine-2'-O-)-methyltransferase|nr:tRNA (cytidine(34)-2'-O)-methyltransferase [Rickettsiales bacterium]
MGNIVLFQPEIAENLGSIIRTAACFGSVIHIIDPCGFPFDSKRIKIAAMDYIDKTKIVRYKSFDNFMEQHKSKNIILMTTKAEKSLSEINISKDSFFIFGQESSGVPEYIHKICKFRAKIPINYDTRSLNLAVSVAITAYSANNISS